MPGEKRKLSITPESEPNSKEAKVSNEDREENVSNEEQSIRTSFDILSTSESPQVETLLSILECSKVSKYLG